MCSLEIEGWLGSLPFPEFLYISKEEENRKKNELQMVLDRKEPNYGPSI